MSAVACFEDGLQHEVENSVSKTTVWGNNLANGSYLMKISTDKEVLLLSFALDR
jgi:hypothetical protein